MAYGKKCVHDISGPNSYLGNTRSASKISQILSIYLVVYSNPSEIQGQIVFGALTRLNLVVFKMSTWASSDEDDDARRDQS